MGGRGGGGALFQTPAASFLRRPAALQRRVIFGENACLRTEGPAAPASPATGRPSRRRAGSGGSREFPSRRPATAMLTAATPGEAHDLGAARHGEEQAGAHAEPLITEFADFEHAKENILPLREGRSAAALSLLFGPRSPAGTSSSGVAEALLAGHAAFNEELEGIDEQDDPLDVYARYIRWTVENYPQGNTPGSKLVPLLEQATRVFRDDARYRNDPRYLKIWLLYARNIQSPKDVYAYLMSNSIGTDIAAYYEDYAECLEKEGRKARPLDRLSRRYKEFQYRVARAAAEDDTPEFPEIDPARAERSVLGTKSHPSSSRSVHNNVTSSALPSASSTVQRSAASRSSFSVFVGLEGTAERKRDKSMPWKDLGTDHSRRKENIREAAPWQGAKLPQSAACAPPRPAEQFKIFREEPGKLTRSVVSQPEEARRDVQIPPANEQQVLRESKTETETSRLMKDPLRNFYSAQVATSASPPSAASPASDARPSAASPASGARLSAAFVASDRRAIHPPVPPTHGDSVKEKVTGDLQVNLDLIYQDGQEFQFEEVRLAAVGTFDLDGPEVPPWSRTAELENRELEETSRREEERQRIEFEEQQRLLSEESRRREKEERAKCDFEIERLRTEEETGRLRIGQEAEILKPAEAEVCLRIGTEVLDIGSRNNVQTTNEVAVGVHGKHPAQVNMHPHDPHHKAYLAGLGTERVSASEASSTTDFTKVTNLENKGKGPASPTINTKAALADIMEMFSQPLKNELEEASYCHAENGGQPRTARHDENEPVFRRASANPAAAGDHPHVGTASRVPLGIKQPTVVSTSSGRSFTVFRDEDADSARPVVLRASDPAAHFNGGRTPMHELRPDGERDVAPRSVPADELEWDEDDEDSALDGDNDDRDFQTLGAHFDDARVPASEDLGYATGSIGESH
ncbi:MAG: Mad3/BUB1 homology region 1-domain-containing protein, partial [Olpidium bornovanus]